MPGSGMSVYLTSPENPRGAHLVNCGDDRLTNASHCLKDTPSCLNECLALKQYDQAHLLIEEGNTFDKESVRRLCLLANQENNQHLTMNADALLASIIHSGVSVQENPICPQLKALIWKAIETPHLNWQCVYDLEGDLLNRQMSFERCAADKLIQNVYPDFIDCLKAAQRQRGEVRPPNPPIQLGQAALDRLLAETFDRTGEYLECDDRQLRIDDLLKQGANPNVLSRYPVMGKTVSLVTRSIQSGDRDMLENLLKYGGTIDPIGLDSLVHVSMEISYFDLGHKSGFANDYLLGIIELIEHHSPIDWTRTVPKPIPFYMRHVYSGCGGTDDDIEYVCILDLLANQFPQMDAIRQKRILERDTQSSQTGDARRL